MNLRLRFALCSSCDCSETLNCRGIEEDSQISLRPYATPEGNGLVRFAALRINQVMQQHQFVDTRELVEERLL